MSFIATGHSYVDVETGTRLDVWYPEENINPARSCLAEQLGIIQGELTETAIEDLSAPAVDLADAYLCLLYTSPSPRDRQKSRMPSSA